MSIQSLSELPDEKIIDIFNLIDDEKDFVALASTDRHFNQCSHDPTIRSVFFKASPKYLTHPGSNLLHSLQNWQKHKIARTIEKNLLSGNPLPKIFETTTKIFNNYQFRCTTIVGDFLVYTSDQLGQVHIYDLRSKIAKVFKIHAYACLRACLGLYNTRPLLVTSIGVRSGIEIWDLNLIMSTSESQPTPLFSSWTLADNFRVDLHKVVDPVLNACGNLIAVAYGNEVRIWDSSQPFSHSTLNIEFEQAIQITFSEEHLLLVSSTELAIWSLSFIQEGLKNAPVNATIHSADSHLKFAKKLACAEIYQDKVVIAYKIDDSNNIGRFETGEVRNWKTGDVLRKLFLTTRDYSITRMDFHSHYLLTGSWDINSWNLTSPQSDESVNKDSKFNAPASAIYAIGKSILYADSTALQVRRIPSLEVEKHLDPHSIGLRTNFERDRANLVSFELLGRYLVTQTNGQPDYETITTRVFDLMAEEKPENGAASAALSEPSEG